MSTVAEIEKALEALPPEQWREVQLWMASRESKMNVHGGRGALPIVAATGHPITQEQIDDALESD